MSSTAKISLLLFSVLFLVKCAVLLPARDNNFIQQEESCQSICEICDCQGFYCGEECICECALKKPENLQCIADMKKDCDEAGLEYELLLQGPQPRILRDLNEYYSNDVEKPEHIILLKHKRQSNDTAVPTTTVEPIVGNTQATESVTPITSTTKKGFFDFIVGNAQNPQAAPGPLPNIQKIMLVLRERMAARRSNQADTKTTAAPVAPTHAPLVIPRIDWSHHQGRIVLPTLPPPKPAAARALVPPPAPKPAAPVIVPKPAAPTAAPRPTANRELFINRKITYPALPALPVLPAHLRGQN